MELSPEQLFGPQWGARPLTRVLKLPDWVVAAHVPFEAVPRERRSAARSKTDRVVWKSAETAGLRVHPEEAAWSLESLRGLQLYSAAPRIGPGWVELRLLWSAMPDWATLLVAEPWNEADQARFAELGASIADFLRIPFERHAAVDA